MTVAVLKIAGAQPSCAARIAPFFCVAELGLTLGPRHKEDLIVFIEFILTIIDAENAAGLKDHADPRLVRGALRLG